MLGACHGRDFSSQKSPFLGQEAAKGEKGQPMGSSMLFWTLTLLSLGLCDRWMMWRDYRQDWVIASLAIILALLGGLAIANMAGGETSALFLIPQIVVSLLVFPLIVRICGGLDRLRWSL